jgi:hypothetical protein
MPISVRLGHCSAFGSDWIEKEPRSENMQLRPCRGPPQETEYERASHVYSECKLTPQTSGNLPNRVAPNRDLPHRIPSEAFFSAGVIKQRMWHPHRRPAQRKTAGDVPMPGPGVARCSAPASLLAVCCHDNPTDRSREVAFPTRLALETSALCARRFADRLGVAECSPVPMGSDDPPDLPVPYQPSECIAPPKGR